MALGDKTEQNGKPISKMEAMRRTLAELGQDAKSLDIQSHVKSEFGLDMNTNVISAYKSTLKKAKKPAVESVPAATASVAKSDVGISVDDLRVIKKMADRIGAAKVKELVEVLGM